MLKNIVKGRVVVFIDASNIYHSQKKLKWQIDFRKLLEYFKDQTELQAIYYYTARDLGHEQQTKFLNFLEMIGYRVRSKKVKIIKDKNKQDEKDGYFKGNLDVELTVDVLENKDSFDTIVLVSGDSDFEPLLQLMKMKYNKRCIVMATKHNVAIELIKCAKYINIAKLKSWISKS